MTDTTPLSDAELAAIEAYRGCGDNSCDTAKPRGMATNGGCRCIDVTGRLFPDERMKLRGHLRARREQVAALLTEVRRLREENAALRKDLGEAIDGWDNDHEAVTGFAPRAEPQSAAIRERWRL